MNRVYFFILSVLLLFCSRTSFSVKFTGSISNNAHKLAAIHFAKRSSGTFYSKGSGNFSDLTNWTSNSNGTGTNPASISDGLGSFVVQTGHTVTVDCDVNIQNISISGALEIGNNATSRTLTLSSIDVATGGSVYPVTAGTTPHQLKISGSISNLGSFNLYDIGGKIVNTEFSGGTISISGNTPVFNDVTFKTGTTTANTAFDIRGNISIENGATFADGGNNHTVKGNWSEAGTGARTGNGSITFNGTVSIISTSSGASNPIVFNNVTFNGGGTYTILENTTVNGAFTVTSNSNVVVGNNTNTLLGDFTVNAGSSYTQNANTILFNGSAAQNITASGATALYNVTFSSGGANTKNCAGIFTVNNLATISSGATVSGNANFNIINGLQINGTCNWSGIITMAGGTLSGTSPVTLGTATLNIAGNVWMGAITFNVYNNVNIQSGYLVLPTGAKLTGQPGNTLSVADNTTLYIRDANNFPTGFGTYSLSFNSWVRYDWNINQTIRGGITYGNLLIDDNSSISTWTKTADAPIALTNSLYLYGATNLDLKSQPLTLGGSIYNGTNSSIINSGTSSTVTLKGSDLTRYIQPAGTGFYNFGNLIIELDNATTTRYTYIQSNLTISGNVTISDPSGSSLALHIVDMGTYGNINASAGTFLLGPYCQLNTSVYDFGSVFLDKFSSRITDVNSTVWYALNGDQQIAAGPYGNIWFNGGNKTAKGALDINGNIAINGSAPIFFDNSFTHTVAGNWALGSANYTQASATGTIVIDGVNQTINTCNFNNLTINNTGIASFNGNLNLYGNLLVNGTAKLDANVYSLNIDGNFINNGLFTQSTGTTTFDGTGKQQLSTTLSSNFFNLVINKPNVTADAQTVLANTNIAVTNNTTITYNAGILDLNSYKASFGGNLDVYYNALGTNLISGNSDIFFNGDVAQAIYTQNSVPLTFKSTTFSGAGTKTFAYRTTTPPVPTPLRMVDINGDVNINGCTVNGGALDFQVSGDWKNNGTFTHNTSDTVFFDGNNQNISSSGFACVVFSNTGNKTLTGNISLTNHLIIRNTATLEPNFNTISLAGNWINTDAGAKFNGTSGTVVFKGNSSVIKSGTSTGPVAGKNFYNVVVNKSAGQYLTLNGDFEIKTDFSLDAGYFQTLTYNMWVGGNMLNNGGIFQHNYINSVLTLNNPLGGNKIFNPGTTLTNFWGITINAPGTTYSVANDFNIQSNGAVGAADLILNAGTLKLNGHTLKVLSPNQKIQINGTGSLDVDAGATLSFASSGQSIINNGILRVVGTSAGIATVNNTGSSIYTITQNFGGTFHAQYYKFDNLGGITINSGGNIDATNNFSNGIFAGGSGTAYLTLNNNFTPFTASNVVFNNGPTKNVSRPISATGKITFQDYSGTLSGTTYENDPGNLIDWTTTTTGLHWTGAAGTPDWHTGGNWSSGNIPTSADIVYLDHSSVGAVYNVDISTNDATAKQIILDAGSGNAITLNLKNNKNLIVSGNVTIGASTTLNASGTTGNISVAGNWSNMGTFTPGTSSTVTFNGLADNYTITSGGTGVGKTFYNLTINATGSTYALTQALKVNNSLTVSAGTFNLSSPSNNLNVGGNWLVYPSAIFNPNTATVTFDGVNQSISGGPFYNFTTAGSGTKTLTQNTDINGKLTIGNTTILDAQDKDLYVAGYLTNNGGSLSQTSSGTIYFDGTSNQEIDYSSTVATTFNHVVLLNSGYKYFNKDNQINGDFTINNGSGVVDFRTAQITGNAAHSLTAGVSTYIQIRGSNNFPAGFGTYNLAQSGFVEYVADIDQTIRQTTDWSYGNLRVTDLTAGSASSTKNILSGNLVITGSLYISDIRTNLDMAANSANMTLTGGIYYIATNGVAFTGGLQINWGTGTSTLNWVGQSGWSLDKNITTFNNVNFAGAGNIYLNNNLNFNGNLTVKNGVNLLMYEPTVNDRIFHTIAGIAPKTFTLENGASLYCPVPATTSSAMPLGFTSYALGANSSVFLNSHDAQTLYTGNNIIYGNLRFLHAKSIASDGIAPLNIDGYFNADSTSFNDGGKDISVAGAYAYISYYTPSSSSVKFTLDGNINQTLYDSYTNTDDLYLDLGTVEFSGSGIKTLGDGNDIVNINGNLKINSGVTLSSSRPITFSGQQWNTLGIVTHTSTITFDSPVDQTIDPGPANAANYLTNLIFSNSNKKIFVNNGADINGNITLTNGSVDLGSGLTHKLYGSIYYTAGTLSSANTNMVLDGYNQDILSPTIVSIVPPTFTVNNLTMATGGTKRMFSNWNINGDLNISNGCYLNTSNNASTPVYSNIFIKGNWNNNGYFTCNTSTVTFNGSAPQINISSNNSNFYYVVFDPTATSEYKLLSPITRFSYKMDLKAKATLNLNSQSLILGSNIAPIPSTDPPTTTQKIFNVSGTLKINERSFLRFNNQGTQCILDILSGGKLSVVGTDNINVATISHEVPSYNNFEAKILVESGGNIEAKYYLIEYLCDGGLYVMPGAHIDAVNNFSYGRWANARNASGINYLNIEADYTGTISNINFDFPGTPTVGNQFNVRRNIGTGAITFKTVSGNLNTYNFEDDFGTTAPSPTAGLLLWDVAPLTNWTGAVNTDWNVAGNWDNGVPDATKDAIISDRPNDPHITNADAVCNNLTLTTGLLYLENGKKLETKGDVIVGTGTNTAVLSVETSSSDITVGGTWTNGTNGIFMNGNGTVRFISGAGISTITPRNYNFYNVVIDNPATTFYLSGSPITFKGSVTVKNGILTPATASYVYNVEKDFVVESGTFNHTGGGYATGTVVFNGLSTQNISNATFYNMIIAGSGTKITHGTVTVANTTLVSSTLKAEIASSIDFNGDVTIAASGTFDDGDQTHYFTGTNWTGTGGYSGAGTVIFDRIGGQNIYASKFNNLDLNSPAAGATITLLGDVAINGNIYVRNSISNLYINTNLISNTPKTGTFQVDGASNIYITGYDNFPVNFLTYSLSPLSYTRYQGASPQLISAGGSSGISYGNLVVNGANVKTLKGNISIQSGLTFNNSTLDVSANNYTITILGSWYNNVNGTFVCRKGNVLFSGSATGQYIYSTLAGGNDFWNLSVDKTSGSVILGNNILYRVINNLTVTNGIFHANNQTVNIEGDMLASGGGTFARSGTYCLKKTSGTANIQTNNSQLYNLTINGGATFMPLDNLRADGNFNLIAGTFDGNGKRVALGSSSNTLNISGYYRTGAGGRLEIGASSTLTVNPSGTIEIVGTSANTAEVTRNLNGGAGYYSFSVAGKILAKYALFEWMASQTNGLLVTGTIDPGNNFSYCTFTNCPNNGAMLSIENTQNDLNGANRIVNASFPVNPGGNSSNVRKISQTTGSIEFYNASGVFAGESFDDDPSNLINWTYPVTLTWNGSQSTDWFNPLNWTTNQVPAADNNVIIAPAVNQPIINKAGAVAGNVLISPSASITVDYTTGTGLDISGDLTINGSFKLNTGNLVTVEGNWTKGNAGSTVLNGDVTLDGSQSATINNGNYPFYNLNISGTASYTLASGSVLKNNITINAGSTLNLDAGSLITLGGNWINNGTCNAQTSTILFNASSGNKIINPGNSNFYNITINGAGANYAMGSNLTEIGNLNLMAGSFNLNGFTLNAGDGSGVDNIFINGILTVNSDAKIKMGASSFLQVNNGGILNLIGTDGHPAAITNQGTGTYSFDINSGGTLAAQYYTVDYTNGNGLYFHSGANLDVTNNLSNGTFSNGTGTYLKFENDFGGSSPTIANVKFNIGPIYNVTRTVGTDYILFKDASGYRGFYLYENDLNGIVDADAGLLHWTYPNTRFWIGTADNNWHNANNWQPKIVPDNSMIAVIPNGVPYYPIISNGTASVKSINLFAGDSLRIEKDLTIADELINQGKIVGAGSPLITVGGDWTGPTGYFRPGQTKVLFNKTSGIGNVNFGNGAFYNLEINAGASYQLLASDTVLNDLTLTAGSFDCSAADLTVGGNWSGTGAFLPGQHTVVFNAASGNHTIDAGPNSFYNLSVNSGNGSGTGTIALLSPLAITNNFILLKGTLDLSPDGGTTSNNLTINKRLTIKGGTLKGNNADISVGENWIVIAPGTFACGTSRVTLTSPDNNIIPGTSPFYDLIINPGANYRISNHVNINHNLNINGTLDASSIPSYNIYLAGDWYTDDAGVFAPQTGAVIFNGATQNINKTANIPFFHVTTNNTQLTLNCNVAVSDTLDMVSGIIATGNHQLTLGNSSNLSHLNYSSGRITGKFERWVNAPGDFLFPVGFDLMNEPITMKTNSIGHVGSVIAEFKNVTPAIPSPNGLPLTEGGFDITTPFSDGYWLLSAANNFASSDYNITLTANGFSSYTVDRDTRIIKRNLTTSNNSWTLDGTHQDGDVPICYRNNILNSIVPEGTVFALAITDCNGGQIASDQYICIGSDVPAFTSTVNAQGGDNYTYTWQYTTDTSPVPGAGTWTDILNSNTAGFDFGTLSETRSFVRKVSGTGCKTNRYSNIIKVTVYPIPITNSIQHIKNN
ncbi:MAG: hypothetical protein Q8928_16505 [Bacteroidota bacterium]|nr:hypothetical protein [Bacteroidota bacterium]